MKKFRFVSFIFVSFFISWIILSGCSIATPKIDSQLEEQVIQIIRNHPEVLIESIQDYQQQQREKLKQNQQSFLQKMKTNPVSVIGDSPITGADAKKIILLEFSDFQCPFCAQAQSTLQQFMTKHQDKVTLVYKHFPLTHIHSEALPSAKAAWAAQKQGKFWEYHDALFAQQKQLGETLYVEIAENLNLDMERFNRDRNSQGTIDAISKDIELADKMGIGSTPFFILNGNILSLPLQISTMEDIISK